MRLSRPNALEFSSQNHSGLPAGAQGLQIGFWSRVTASGAGGEEWRSWLKAGLLPSPAGSRHFASSVSYLLAGGFAPFLGKGEGRLILPLSSVPQQEFLPPPSPTPVLGVLACSMGCDISNRD